MVLYFWLPIAALFGFAVGRKIPRANAIRHEIIPALFGLGPGAVAWRKPEMLLNPAAAFVAIIGVLGFAYALGSFVGRRCCTATTE